jgi:hypothetical protein
MKMSLGNAYGYDLSGVYINHTIADPLYQYNGKEKQDDHGIGMYDYSARFMDLSIGRFITVDALASKPEQVDISIKKESFAHSTQLDQLDQKLFCILHIVFIDFDNTIINDEKVFLFFIHRAFFDFNCPIW